MAYRRLDDRIFEGQTPAACTRLITAQKGQRTRAVNKLNGLIAAQNANPAPATTAQILETLDNIKYRAQLIADGYSYLQVHDHANYEAHEAAAVVVATATDVSELAALEAIRQAPANPQIAAAPPQAQAQGCRIVETLRPPTLAKGAKPHEFRSWSDRFKAFYTGSNMTAATIGEQHQYLIACLDTHLENYICSRKNPNTPIFEVQPGDQDCIMAFLDDEFKSAYPLNTRRYAFLTAKMASGQTWSDFTSEADNKGDEADLAALDIEALHCLVYIMGCTDEALQRHLMQVENPTRRNLRQAGRTYESLNNFNKTAKTQQVSSSSSAQKPKDKKNKTAGGGQNLAKRDRLRAEGKCLRCASTKHETTKCPSKDKLKCTQCNKQGHTAVVCLMPVANSSETRQPEQPLAAQYISAPTPAQAQATYYQPEQHMPVQYQAAVEYQQDYPLPQPAYPDYASAAAARSQQIRGQYSKNTPQTHI